MQNTWPVSNKKFNEHVVDPQAHDARFNAIIASVDTKIFPDYTKSTSTTFTFAKNTAGNTRSYIHIKKSGYISVRVAPNMLSDPMIDMNVYIVDTNGKPKFALSHGQSERANWVISDTTVLPVKAGTVLELYMKDLGINEDQDTHYNLTESEFDGRMYDNEATLWFVPTDGDVTPNNCFAHSAYPNTY